MTGSGSSAVMTSTIPTRPTRRHANGVRVTGTVRRAGEGFRVSVFNESGRQGNRPGQRSSGQVRRQGSKRHQQRARARQSGRRALERRERKTSTCPEAEHDPGQRSSRTKGTTSGEDDDDGDDGNLDRQRRGSERNDQDGIRTLGVRTRSGTVGTSRQTTTTTASDGPHHR